MGAYQYQGQITGDLNNDSSINIADIVILVNLIINNEYSLYGDLNEDEDNNIQDIVLLVNSILNN